MKSDIKARLESMGVHLRLVKNLPAGIDWKHDIKNRVSIRPDPVFFDVGANVGQTSTALLARFPRAQIHAFEPVRDTYATLAENCAGQKRIHTYNHALGSSENTLKITARNNSLTNTIVTDEACVVDEKLETIQVRTADQICSELNIDHIDLLKSDTEGHDLEVLRGAEKMLDEHRVSCILCESTIDPDDTRHTSFFDIYDYLIPRGYRCASFYDLNNMFRDHSYGSYFDSMFIIKSKLK